MEFQGQRGDPFSAWSVGKYAKRSATIHLCSEDFMTEKASFVAMVASYSAQLQAGEKGTISVFDLATGNPPVNPIRAAVPFLEDGHVRIFNPAMGLTYDTSKISLFNNGQVLGPGVPPVVIQGFTKIELDNDKYNNLDRVHNIFTPLTVREIDPDEDAYGLAREDVHDTFMVERYTYEGTTYYKFLLPNLQFPHGLQDKTTEVVRLAKDAVHPGVLPGDYPEKQINKGYILELVNWDLTGNNANDIGRAEEYFVPVKFGGYENQMGNHLGVEAREDQMPPNLKAFLDPRIDPHPDGHISLGGRAFFTAEDGGKSIATPAQGRGADNQANRIMTWNMFPATKIQAINHTFDSPTDNHCNYTATIPNTIGYPEHKRCLVQVQSFALHGERDFAAQHLDRINPMFIGVEVEGMGVQHNFSSHNATSSVTNSNIIGYTNFDLRSQNPQAYQYTNTRSIVDDGILCSSPFGKQIRVRFLNLTNKKILNTNSDDGLNVREGESPADIIHNPTHLTLRLLFLDDDELPMR